MNKTTVKSAESKQGEQLTSLSANAGSLSLNPYYQDDRCTIYHGDCLEILESIASNMCVITDPPYPNNAGHFVEDIIKAQTFFLQYKTNQILTFWDEILGPVINLPLVAKHIWHRSNTNRPDNYEMIYHYHLDRKKRASRVLSYPVIYPGLTGCVEAIGHPTQKNLKLMERLIIISKSDIIFDPFMGSGTTLEAAKRLGIKAVGIERKEEWCEKAKTRLAQCELF